MIQSLIELVKSSGGLWYCKIDSIGYNGVAEGHYFTTQLEAVEKAERVLDGHKILKRNGLIK